MNTIIVETPLASPVFNGTVDYSNSDYAYTFSDIVFGLTPAVVEGLMKNVTISIFNNAQHSTITGVEVTTYKSAYVFKDQFRLIVSYASALIVCLVFVLLGFMALVQNGTAASSGGFYQFLCTTTHSSGAMNQLARETSLRNTEHVPKELANLKVRFGMVGDGGRRHAAFGTAEEIRTLVKTT